MASRASLKFIKRTLYDSNNISLYILYKLHPLHTCCSVDDKKLVVRENEIGYEKNYPKGRSEKFIACRYCPSESYTDDDDDDENNQSLGDMCGKIPILQKILSHAEGEYGNKPFVVAGKKEWSSAITTAMKNGAF